MGYASYFEDISNRLEEFSHQLEEYKTIGLSSKVFEKFKKDSVSLIKKMEPFLRKGRKQLINEIISSKDKIVALNKELASANKDIKLLQNRSANLQREVEDFEIKFSDIVITINRKDKSIVGLKSQLTALTEKFDNYHTTNSQRQNYIVDHEVKKEREENTDKALKLDSILKEVDSIVNKHNFPKNKEGIERIKTIIKQWKTECDF